MSQVEEGKGDEGRKDSTCDNATKGTAKGVEEKFSTCLKTEGTGALWRGYF